MRLSDIVGHMGLAFWPQAAMLLFLSVFFAVAWREWFRPSRHHDRAAVIPFDEE